MNSQTDAELREQIEQSFSSAFQDGFYSATKPEYRNRTREHTDRVLQLIKALVLERIDNISESTIKADDYQLVNDTVTVNRLINAIARERAAIVQGDK